MSTNSDPSMFEPIPDEQVVLGEDIDNLTSLYSDSSSVGPSVEEPEQSVDYSDNAVMLENEARTDNRHGRVNCKRLFALAALGAAAAVMGPLAETVSAQGKMVTPNPKVVRLLSKDLKPMESAIISEYRKASPSERYTAIDTNTKLRSYVVAIKAYSDVTRKQADYYLRAEVPSGKKVIPANVKEVAIYIPENPVSLSVAAQSDRDGSTGSSDATDLAMYEFAFQKNLASDYNDPSTSLERHETNLAVRLSYGRTTKSNPTQLSLSREWEGGWYTFDYTLTAQTVDDIVPQADEILDNAKKHSSITLAKVLCSHEGFLSNKCVAN